MDAVLKHLGLRSDFIVCHPDVIDDPLFRARRPPLLASIPNTHTRTHAHASSLTSSYFSLPELRRAALPAHLLRILSISHIHMDPGARN